MNLLFTVCGRAGSKGVRNKNIKDFCGHPLVYYTLSAIELFIKEKGYEYENINIALNTDSTELVELVDKSNIEYMHIERKAALATDTSSKLDVIKDTLKVSEARKGIKYDFVVDLDITSPLRTVDDIIHLMNKVNENNETEVVFSVTTSRRNPYFNMVMRDTHGIRKVIDSNYTARQQAPTIYDMNASMYVYKRAFLYDDTRKSLFDANTDIIEMIDTGVLDIDHSEDFELMQVIAPYFYNKYPAFNTIREHITKLK